MRNFCPCIALNRLIIDGWWPAQELNPCDAPARCLHSSSQPRLLILSVNEKHTKKQFGFRAFSNWTPRLWNALPQTLRPRLRGVPPWQPIANTWKLTKSHSAKELTAILFCFKIHVWSIYFFFFFFLLFVVIFLPLHPWCILLIFTWFLRQQDWLELCLQTCTFTTVQG